MSYPRPSGTGWITGADHKPVQVASEPPGDGIGPHPQPPDVVANQDPREVKRLQRDHREAVKAADALRVDPREGQGDQ